MDEDKKQKVKIGIAVGCLLLAGIILFATMGGGGGGAAAGASGEVHLVCVNPECEAVTTMDTDEIMDHMQQTAPDNMMMMPPHGQPTAVCPVCGELSCFMGRECPDCGEIFIPDPMGGPDGYVCPECGKKFI